MLMKAHLTRKIKNEIKYLLSSNKHTYDAYRKVRKVIVCLGADYGNLGDVAITFAQMDFLKKIFKEYEVLEFPISSTYLDMKSLESIVSKEDVITLIGGGNTSERYADIEECRQFVLRKFPHNIIISFPQSVELENASLQFIRDMQKVYSLPEHLYLMARERTSYEAYKRYLPNVSVKLFPDIVLSMNVPPVKELREYITISLRSDSEKCLSSSDEKALRAIIEKSGVAVVEKDTQVTNCNDFSQISRKRLLQTQLEQYQKSRVVITDRLHGMIMAYITNTPCIVLPCDNPKIKGCYSWIASSNQTVFLEQFSEQTFYEVLHRLLDSFPYANEPVNFEQMERYIELISKT